MRALAAERSTLQQEGDHYDVKISAPKIPHMPDYLLGLSDVVVCGHMTSTWSVTDECHVAVS